MSVQAEIPHGHPMRDAWETYKATEEYVNTRRWALNENHVDGSLWASFCAGYAANHPTANQADAEQLRELVKVVEEMEGACVYPDGSPSTNTIEPGSVRSWAFRLRAARAQSDGRSGGSV